MSSESFTSPTSCSITTAVSNFSKSVVALFMIVGILFTANTAAADLVGLEVETINGFDDFGGEVLVCQVYAAFDDPTDELISGGGTAAAPLNISVTNGTFYQHPIGSDTAPPAALVGVIPALAFALSLVPLNFYKLDEQALEDERIRAKARAEAKTSTVSGGY